MGNPQNNKLIPIISIRGLTKKYGQLMAIDHLNLDIHEFCFALLGPNGAGKTTTILTLLGLIKPTSGTATIFGKNIIKEPIEIRKRVGYLPENVGFFHNMTGFDHLNLFFRLRTNVNNTRERIESLLEWCGLNEGFWDKKIRTYSQGMRQRLGLAIAFAGEPEIVFLDEPLSNIDPLGRTEFINKINMKRREGISIIISSHIIPEVERVADSIAIIDKGRIKSSDSIISLAQNLGYNEYEINNIHNNNKQQSLNQLAEIISMEKDLFLEKPIVLSDKIILKTNYPNKIKLLLEKYNEYEIRPISGTLEKIYKKIILEKNDA